MEKGSKDQEERTSRIMGSKSSPSGVGISHHPSPKRLVHREERGRHHEQEEEGEVNAQKGRELAMSTPDLGTPPH